MKCPMKNIYKVARVHSYMCIHVYLNHTKLLFMDVTSWSHALHLAHNSYGSGLQMEKLHCIIHVIQTRRVA